MFYYPSIEPGGVPEDALLSSIFTHALVNHLWGIHLIPYLTRVTNIFPKDVKQG